MPHSEALKNTVFGRLNAIYWRANSCKLDGKSYAFNGQKHDIRCESAILRDKKGLFPCWKILFYRKLVLNKFTWWTSSNDSFQGA